MKPKPGDYVLIKDNTDPGWDSRDTGAIYKFIEKGDFYPQLLIISPPAGENNDGLHRNYRVNTCSIDERDLEKI